MKSNNPLLQSEYLFLIYLIMMMLGCLNVGKLFHIKRWFVNNQV